jgi:hypothetical protein
MKKTTFFTKNQSFLSSSLPSAKVKEVHALSWINMTRRKERRKEMESTQNRRPNHTPPCKSPPPLLVFFGPTWLPIPLVQPQSGSVGLDVIMSMWCWELVIEIFFLLLICTTWQASINPLPLPQFPFNFFDQDLQGGGLVCNSLFIYCLISPPPLNHGWSWWYVFDFMLTFDVFNDTIIM